MSPLVRGALRVIALAALVLALIAACTTALAAGLAYVQDVPFLDAENLTVGLVCSLIAGLFVAAFHLWKETATVPVSNAGQFLTDAATVLQEMGYVVARPTPRMLTSRPGFSAFLFGQGIAVELDGAVARLTGPKVCLERLRKRLRVHAQVGHVQRHMRSDRCHGSARLRRVEIELRVRPEQLQAVRSHVLDVLSRDAEVTCDLHLFAHSEAGIDEGVLDNRLRGWLFRHDPHAVIHKEHVRYHEPAVAEPGLRA